MKTLAILIQNKEVEIVESNQQNEVKGGISIVIEDIIVG